MDSNIFEKKVIVIFLIVLSILIIFSVLGSIAPTLSDSANSVTLSGLPLSSVLSGAGLLILLSMVVILIIITIVKSFQSK